MTKNYIQKKHATATATLLASDWYGTTHTQTVSVTGVTASNTVFVSPDGDDYLDYANAQIRATAQGSGTITFTCGTIPTSDITINAVILG